MLFTQRQYCYTWSYNSITLLFKCLFYQSYYKHQTLKTKIIIILSYRVIQFFGTYIYLTKGIEQQNDVNQSQSLYHIKNTKVFVIMKEFVFKCWSAQAAAMPMESTETIVLVIFYCSLLLFSFIVLCRKLELYMIFRNCRDTQSKLDEYFHLIYMLIDMVQPCILCNCIYIPKRKYLFVASPVYKKTSIPNSCTHIIIFLLFMF